MWEPSYCSEALLEPFTGYLVNFRAKITVTVHLSRAGAAAAGAALCGNWLAVEPALWTFVYKRGVEPTNNHIERLLRPGVLWCKNAFGCHSERGCRFVERLLTVVQTLRLQKRPALPFLYEALVAHRAGHPAPRLLLG